MRDHGRAVPSVISPSQRLSFGQIANHISGTPGTGVTLSPVMGARSLLRAAGGFPERDENARRRRTKPVVAKLGTSAYPRTTDPIHTTLTKCFSARVPQRSSIYMASSVPLFAQRLFCAACEPGTHQPYFVTAYSLFLQSSHDITSFVLGHRRESQPHWPFRPPLRKST